MDLPIGVMFALDNPRVKRLLLNLYIYAKE